MKVPAVLRDVKHAKLKARSTVNLGNIYGYDLQHCYPKVSSDSSALEIIDVVAVEENRSNGVHAGNGNTEMMQAQRVGVVFCDPNSWITQYNRGTF